MSASAYIEWYLRTKVSKKGETLNCLNTLESKYFGDYCTFLFSPPKKLDQPRWHFI